MDTTQWILAIAAAIIAWTALLALLKEKKVLTKERGCKVDPLLKINDIEVPGPLLIIETQRFAPVIEALAKSRGVWRTIVTLGMGLVVVFMVGMFLVLVLGVVGMLLMGVPDTPGVHSVASPQNILVIPGVNQFVPFWYGWLALLVGIVVHEAGHAVLARAEGIKLKSVGVMLFLGVPIAAFADIDEEELFGVKKGEDGKTEQDPSLRKASYGAFMRIVGAGVIMNIIVFALTFAAMGWLVGQIVPDTAEYAAPLQNLGSAWYLYMLPINQFTGDATGFNIFYGEAAAHYTIGGPAALLGTTGVFILIQALFWVWWLNINLALTNCIPMLPMDGGHLFMDTLRVLARKLFNDEKRAGDIATYGAVAISIIALLSFVGTYVLIWVSG